MKTGRIFLGAFLLALAAGCSNVRFSAVPKVENLGEPIATKYTYRLAGYKVRGKPIEFAEIKEAYEAAYPSVFSDDGFPIELHEREVRNRDADHEWTVLLSLGSAFVLPYVKNEKKDLDFDVTVLSSDSPREHCEIHIERAEAVTMFSPLGCFFWNGRPDTGGYRCFAKTVFNEGHYDSHRVEINRLAMGYGVAVRLKQLEAAGRIIPAKFKRKAPPVTPAPGKNPLPVTKPSQPVPNGSKPEKPASATPPAPVPPAPPVPAKVRPAQMFEVDNITL